MQIVRRFFSTRPRDPAERLRCIEFAKDIDAAKVHAIVRATLTLGYRPVAEVYVRAMAGNKDASSDVSDGSDAVGLAAAEFEKAFKLWVTSIDDARDEPGFAESALVPHLGHPNFSTFLRDD